MHKQNNKRSRSPNISGSGHSLNNLAKNPSNPDVHPAKHTKIDAAVADIAYSILKNRQKAYAKYLEESRMQVRSLVDALAGDVPPEACEPIKAFTITSSQAVFMCNNAGTSDEVPGSPGHIKKLWE